MNAQARIEKVFADEPLLGFSVYTHLQRNVLKSLENEILGLLDQMVLDRGNSSGSTHISGEITNRVYGMFWLWVLGAYEVVRTMCQAEGCFSPHASMELQKLKRTLAALRMPFAKQELPGKEQPIQAEASIWGIDIASNDLRFLVQGETISMRATIRHFGGVFSGIKKSDVQRDHRSAYVPAS